MTPIWRTTTGLWALVWTILALLGGARPYACVTMAFATSSSVVRTGTRKSRIHLLRSVPRTTTAASALKKPFHFQQNAHGLSGSHTELAALPTTMLVPRGGAAAAAAPAAAGGLLGATSPHQLFQVTLVALAVVTVAMKVVERATQEEPSSAAKGGAESNKKPAAIQSMQTRFLSVFWLLRAADWLQGPYFYEVYASKMVKGVPASFALVSRLFLTGFASTAVFGPAVGRAADQYGRKRATVAFTVLYALGALSTKSPLLMVLFAGRVLSGIGTSLLFSAPESWLVGEALKTGADTPDGKYLGETFGLAYAGDSIVAIVAGQLAAWAATKRGGATGPFELSTLFLVAGGVLAAFLWGENKATLKPSETTSIQEAVDVVRQDPKIMLVGGVQSLFEAAMYIFVLQWPPAMAAAVERAFPSVVDGVGGAITPYGTIFSCFMACCLLGSTLFGQLAAARVPTEKSTVAMLGVATAAMTTATWTLVGRGAPASLPLLMAAFFAFEACVGMYFPSIGTLRSRYVPDSHRSVIMNLFGIPLNVLVVSVFLSIHRLGVGGALGISSGALGLATVCMYSLRRIVSGKTKKQKGGGNDDDSDKGTTPKLDYVI